MSVIRQLKNWFTKQNIYPRTVEQAIYDSNGRRLDNKLENGIANPNILINSGFGNLVNQRGYVSGTRIVHDYSIDRWKTLGILNLNGDYVRLNSIQIGSGETGSGETLGYIVQRIEFPQEFRNKTVTLSLRYKTDDVDCYLGLHTIESGTGRVRVYFVNLPTTNGAWKTYSATIQCEDIDYDSFEYCVYIGNILEELNAWYDYNSPLSVKKETTIDIMWAKLEDGNVPTPYKPRLYAEKLALCRRYFRYGSTDTQSMYDFPMRVTPTITSVSTGKYSYDAEL